jgi:hypothetical protein
MEELASKKLNSLVAAAAGARAAPRSLRWRRPLTTDPNAVLLLVIPTPTKPRERHCRELDRRKSGETRPEGEHYQRRNTTTTTTNDA